MATLDGFQSFVYGNMGINTTVLPTTSPDIATAYNLAIETVNQQISIAAPLSYDTAVYNLAGDYLINYASDQTGQTYFANLRADFHIYDFVAGVVQSADDQSTSDSLEIPESLKQLTLGDLQNLKTPYGRVYLAIAQKVGTLWGIT